VSTISPMFGRSAIEGAGRWTQIDSPVGPLPALRPPAITDTFDYRMDAVPKLGEHTNHILQELGHSTAEINALRTRAIV
jgi:itaconate CoA-transferase